MLKQVVLLKLRTPADPDDEQMITERLQQLKQTIPGVLSMSFGRNRLYDADQDYSHIFMMDFVDEAYYQLFQQHPDTQAFMTTLEDKLALALKPKLVIEYPLQMILA